ncbi:MAG: tetratricopeptide repeat protein [Dehalococcoidia bacterium]
MGRCHIVLLLTVALTVSSILAACAPATGLAEFEQGNRLAEESLFEQAIESYDEAIRINSQFGDAYRNRGRAYTSLKQFEQAIENFDAAIQLNPEDALAYLFRGASYTELGRRIEAIEDFEKFIALSDNPQLTEAARQQIEELEE